MIDPLTLCLAAMLYVEARGSDNVAEKVAMIQAAEMRSAINQEHPKRRYFAGGSTDLCAIVSHAQWYGPGGHDIMQRVSKSENVKTSEAFALAYRAVGFVLTHDLPFVAGGAPCFRTKRGTKDAIVIGDHEFGWWCSY